jgi:hypothetical protein
MFVEIKGNNSLVRDTSSMAIINTDRQSLKRYTEQRNKILSDKDRIANLEKELSDLKTLVFKLIGEK